MESLFSLLLTLFTLKKILATTQKIGNSNITFILTFRLRAKPRLNVSFWNVLEKIMNLIRPYSMGQQKVSSKKNRLVLIQCVRQLL